jgi:hypothetical protein
MTKKKKKKKKKRTSNYESLKCGFHKPKVAHKRTSLASESGWARVPMNQTRPSVECHEPESTHACVVKYIRAWLPSQAPRGELESQTRTVRVWAP